MIIVTAPHSRGTAKLEAIHWEDPAAGTAAEALTAALGPSRATLFLSDHYRPVVDLNRLESRQTGWRQRVREALPGAEFLADVHSYPPDDAEWGKWHLVIMVRPDDPAGAALAMRISSSMTAAGHPAGAVQGGWENDLLVEASELGVPGLLFEFNEGSDPAHIEEMAGLLAGFLINRENPPIDSQIESEIRKQFRSVERVGSDVWEASEPAPKDQNPKAPKAIVVDIDGTIADVTARFARAAELHPSESGPAYWDEAMSGDYYHLDAPIAEALERLGSYPGEVIYLSGRRTGTEHQTEEWLSEHGFPPGRIIHRPRGLKTGPWKEDQVRNLLAEGLVIEEGWGDAESDQDAYEAAGIRAWMVPWRENPPLPWEMKGDFKFVETWPDFALLSNGKPVVWGDVEVTFGFIQPGTVDSERWARGRGFGKLWYYMLLREIAKRGYRGLYSPQHSEMAHRVYRSMESWPGLSVRQIQSDDEEDEEYEEGETTGSVIEIQDRELFLSLGDPTQQANPPKFQVDSPEEGAKVIMHKDFVRNFEKGLKFQPKHRKAVMVPCAATKPFPEAPSHKHGYLQAIEGKPMDVFAVGEPFGVIPYSWSTKYPNDAYDFHPKHLRGEAFDLLADRVARWIRIVANKYDRVYLALPAHHRRLVKAAQNRVGDDLEVEFVDVGLGGEYRRSTDPDYQRYLRRRLP